MESGERPFSAASFSQFLTEHRLMGSRCRSCGAVQLPPRPMCPACYNARMEWVQMPDRGRLLAFTSIYIAPTAMIEAGYGRDKPYCAGIVELEGGAAISGQILGVEAARPDQISVGMPVKAKFVERGQGDKKRTYLGFEAG